MPLIILLLLIKLFLCNAVAGEGVWLLVDTQAMNLIVKRDQKTIDVFENISIGRNGAGFKEQRGDDVTPLGIYKISWINVNSPFRKFYGFNYPSRQNAKKALGDGLISRKTYRTIEKAHLQHRIPPQHTALGGRLGIHGLGHANRNIHNKMNWTHGCIALTNAQIDRLAKWINKGTMVKVK